jgi:hypothetical protein
MIHKTEEGLRIESKTTVVEISEGRLVSIRSARTGEEFLDRGLQEGVPAFDLYHQTGKVSPLGVHPLASKFHYRLLSDRIAEMVLDDWECDVSVRIAIDEERGEILLEPSAWTMQGGVAGIGLHIAGIRDDLDLIAPFQQGFRGKLNEPQVQGTRAAWPRMWEAAVLALAGEGSGFSVQAHDTHYIHKGVHIGHEASPQTATFVTYAEGPLEMNRCVGNVAWRISAWEGDWRSPFLQYRDWYWKAYALDALAALRPDWLDQITLAVSWCPTNLDLLDALATKANPGNVFLHLPHWRTFKYDQDYPTFTPSPEGRAFIEKALAMGYHVAPHANLCQLSPDHPFFQQARDFCTRSPTEMRWGGWSWLPVEGWGNAGPPQSYSTMAAVKDWNVLLNAHLAWSPWRRHLTGEIADLIRETGIDSIFVDVSHHVHNSDNAHLENLSYAEGSLKLAREIAELKPGLCVSGEGRSEITTQYISMVQFHLYNYAHSLMMDGKDISWLERCTVPVSALIFDGLSRGIGYSYGRGGDQRLMIDAQLKQGAIPTLILRAEDPVAELEGEVSRYILEHVDAP